MNSRTVLTRVGLPATTALFTAAASTKPTQTGRVILQ